MSQRIFVAGVALLAVGLTAQSASAQCAFEHPQKAKQIKASLTQAMVSCGNPGGNTPNTTTTGGFPSCTPPETYHQQAFSPPEGWTWDELKGSGDIMMKAAKNKIVHPLNNPSNTADVSIQIKMKGVLDDFGPASGNGALILVVRTTLEDDNGDMTVVDTPAGFGISVINGKVSKKTSANVYLNGIGQPGLPGCTSLELIDLRIIDSNGIDFASIGLFLPDL